MPECVCAAPWLCRVHLPLCASPACKGHAQGCREGRAMLWAVELPTPRVTASRSPQGQGFVPAPLVTTGPLWGVPGPGQDPPPPSLQNGVPPCLCPSGMPLGGAWTLRPQVKRLGWEDSEPVSHTPARPEVCCFPLCCLGCVLRCGNPQVQSTPESH